MKAKREKKVVNFGFEMSESFKRSVTLPCIVEHETNDKTSIHDLKELILKMTAFHAHNRIHIEAVEETLKHIVCKFEFVYICRLALLISRLFVTSTSLISCLVKVS